MSAGLDNLKHIVVLMMENRSFDHMIGAMKAQNPAINGLTGNETNPDTTGALIQVQPKAAYQGQFASDPDHHFPGVDIQIFGGAQGLGRVANMQGFIKSYFQQTNDVNRSHNVMHYFTPNQLPVLTTLVNKFAVFNSWFASIPGPTICNRAFAHYGTSFGQVGMDVFYVKEPYKSIYERMIAANRTAKIYYYDQASSTMEIVNLLNSQPQLFATFDQFRADCQSGNLPDYSFIEPNYNDHQGDDGGAVLASDQHPDHNIQQGELFIASVYNLIRENAALWQTTAILVVYDEHGGLYDHVVPPACTPDGFKATGDDTGTGQPFAFDRLGIRVPAILISPWVAAGTVIDGRTFEHASIPATVTGHFIGAYDQRTPREKAADTFLDLLSLDTMRQDWTIFNVGGAPAARARAGGDSNAVSIPQPDPASYNPNRPASQLLLDQVKHLNAAEQKLPAAQQTGMDISKIRTEAQASAYIKSVTAKVHPAAARGQGQ